MRVQWLHNNKDTAIGTFMWDILERLRGDPDIFVDDRSIPVVRSFGALRKALAPAPGLSRPDIVHGQFGSLVGTLTGLTRAPVRLLSFRGSDIYWRYGNRRTRLSGLIRVAMSWFGAVRSDAVIVMSHAMRTRVLHWPLMRRKPVHIIADPAGAIFWPEAARDIADALRSTPHRVLTASVHRDNPVKRIGIIEDAAALCVAAGMAVELMVLSGKSRDEVPDVMLGVDTVALASTHEGWPNVVKETLLLGRTFVATDVGDLSRHAGDGSGNHIAAAHPVDFACAFVDQIAARALQKHGIDAALAGFHPDVVSLKHTIMYIHYIRIAK